MRHFRYAFFLFLASILLVGCTISHTYGPYMGKVVDKKTNKPIEGAVVFMKFWVNGFGGASTFVDAIEVLTDVNGEFNIPAQRIYFIRPLYDSWESSPIIFKPGYGAFPRHRGVKTNFQRSGWLLPANKLVIIKLPKLKTKEERADNVIGLWLGSGVPKSKYKRLEQLKKIEFNQLDKGK